MKTEFNIRYKLTFILLVTLLIGSLDVFAQGAPPPPPGVPLDFGLTAFISLCIGYGIVKMKGKAKK